MDNPTTTLEELFLSIVRDSEARPGRRAKQDSKVVKRVLCDPPQSDQRYCTTLVQASHGTGKRHLRYSPTGSGLRCSSFVQIGGRAGPDRAGGRLSGRGVSLRPAGGRRRHVPDARSAGSPTCSRISPRRILALAWLAVQESLRRRVLVGFAVFLLILLFAGWFLDTQHQRPGHALSELRAHGHDVSGAADGAVSERLQPAGRHQESRRSTRSSPSRCDRARSCWAASWASRSSARCCWPSWACSATSSWSACSTTRTRSKWHRWSRSPIRRTERLRPAARVSRRTIATRSTVDADGKGATDVVNGHWHTVDRLRRRRRSRPIELGPPRDMLMARVPAYGELRFKDRTGQGTHARHQRRQRMEVPQLHRRRPRWPRPSGSSTTSRPSDFPTACPSK